jgi:hypothetical protein
VLLAALFFKKKGLFEKKYLKHYLTKQKALNMKRLTLLLILTVAAGITFYFTSCTKDKVYSCDKNLNQYAIQFQDANQSISRENLAKLGIDTQFAIFNSLTSENKTRIFTEKIETLLADESITQADKEHLLKLKNYISPKLYEQDDKIEDPFLKSWQATAFKTLQWDRLKMFLYIETWLTKEEYTLIADVKKKYTTIGQSPYTDGGSGNSCVCNSRFACSFGFSDCVTGGCTTTTDGCGIIGSNPCEGTCN